MAKSSLSHAKPNGSSLFAVLSLNVLQSLEQERIGDLNQIGIFSLGDLLYYKPVIYAQTIVAVSNREIGHDLLLERYLDNAFLTTPIQKLPDLPIKAIEGIGVAIEAIFNNKFKVYTIGELAVFPPFVEAQRYLTPDKEVFNEPSSAPEELMPQILGNTHSIARFNDYIIDTEIELKSPLFSTEKDELNDVLFKIFETVTLTPVQKEGLESALSNLYKDSEFSPKQKDELNSAIFNIFQTNETFTLFFGIIAAYTQKWVNMGTHLGEVIHSASLAPGESKNFAMIEWYRRQSSNRDEKTVVDEKLTNNLVHTRAINEVVRATTNEHQSGQTSINSKTSSFGASANIAVSIPPVEGVSASISEGAVYSNNKQVGTVKSSSEGIREVLGDSQQNIMEATSQNSSNVRSLYSTIVVTDEQSEKESIQTSSITNYNHSHMLNILHYEILQKYNILMSLDSSAPIIFIPFKPIKFDIDTITKYWLFFKKGFLNEFPELYDRFNRVIKANNQIDSNFTVNNQILLEKIAVSIEGTSPLITLAGGQQIFNAHESLVLEINNPTIVNHSFKIKDKNTEYLINAPLSSVKEIVLARPIDLTIKRYNENKAIVKNMVSTINVVINIDFFIKDSSGIPFKFQKSFPKTISIHEWWTAVSLAYVDLSGNSTNPLFISNNIGEEITRLINDLSGLTKQDLIKEVETHFLQYRYSYTRKLLASIEGDQLIDIVESMKFKIGTVEQRLSKFVHPSPIAITGNYLIFKPKKFPSNPSENPIWAELKKLMLTVESYKRDSNNIKKATVFLPTAGVFGEAILGRSNASEFVDPRRFWNWQDSPIPHLAPEIAAIQAGNHTVTDLTSSLTPNVPTSNLNIINPPQYALPTGLSDALQAVQNGNMFRDMSKTDGLTSVLSSLAELANNTAKTAATMSGDAAERALQGALKLGEKVGNMTEKAIDKKDTPTPPKNQTEKSAAVNLLAGLQKNLTSEGKLISTDAAMAKVMGVNFDEGNLGADESIDLDATSKKNDFRELIREQNGTGKWHINHFISYFKIPKESKVNTFSLTFQFFENFTKIFNDDNWASAEVNTEKWFNGKTVIEFNLGGENGLTIDKVGGFLHSDWVALEQDFVSGTFYARTLARNLNLAEQLAIRAALEFSEYDIASAISSNACHFLSGRRSWKIGFDEKKSDVDSEYNYYFIETAAIERYTLKFMENLKDFLRLEFNIIKIWSDLLSNGLRYFKFDNHMDSALISEYESDDYKSDGISFYKVYSIPAVAIISQGSTIPEMPNWFESVRLRHPGLTIK